MDHLKFAHIDYSITTRSLDIFTIGCFGSCVDCCNPEIKDFELKGFSILQVVSKVIQLDTKYGNLIDKILLVGGDPYDGYLRYKEEFADFVRQIRTIGKPIFLFTRHEIDEISDEILHLVDYVKTGAYIPELTCDNNIQEGIKLATSNQRIYKTEQVLEERDEHNKVCK